MPTTIPALHVPSLSAAKGKGEVFIESRKDASASGIFAIEISVSFDPAVDAYPTGSVLIKTDLSDSVKGTFKSTSIELINSHGKHNPTVFLTGRCDAEAFVRAPIKGARFWLMVADNTNKKDGTPDIVGFCINDRKGNHIAYGTGPLKGNIVVQPT